MYEKTTGQVGKRKLTEVTEARLIDVSEKFPDLEYFILIGLGRIPTR
jgi:hypothetical protein